ncbi:MAG: hypothetical protein DRO23_08355 [Thermoprotei archaeon]|nr:MAG: hypothetical protein DRO23_08355 [Thermoprotei archaeon]
MIFSWKSPGKAKELVDRVANYLRSNLSDVVKSLVLYELREGILYDAVSVRASVKLHSGSYLNYFILKVKNNINSFVSLDGYFKNRKLGTNTIELTFVDTLLWTRWKLKIQPRYAQKHPLVDFYRKYEQPLKSIYERAVKTYGKGKIVYFKAKFGEQQVKEAVTINSTVWFKGGFINREMIMLLNKCTELAETYFSKKLSQTPLPEPLKTINIGGI